MLTFVDLEKHVRIVRVTTEDGVSSRTNLGRISKVALEIDPAMAEQLSADERSQVERVLAGYADQRTARKRYYALGLPTILREAMEHYESDAGDTERSFMMAGIMEALRRMRKFERESLKG